MNGYQCETHFVITSDGYILQLHRIVNNTNQIAGIKNDTVLIVHGLSGSSADWVALGKAQGLGMQ